jgi:peptidoglycan/LPS O-acetylase OafA/YrhL
LPLCPDLVDPVPQPVLSSGDAAGRPRDRRPGPAPPPLAWLGRRLSYGIYLWHYPLLALAGSFGLTGLARTIAVVLSTLAAAGLTYALVERPIASRKIARRPGVRNLVSSE